MASSPAQIANAEGVAALRSGDAAAAVAAFRRATAADPGAGPLWRNLAHGYRLAGDAEGERAALNQALAIDQRDFPARLRLAQLQERLGEEAMALVSWSAVQQLAAGLPGISPELAVELEAGERYCEGLRGRLASAADAAIAGDAARNETEDRRVRAFVDHALGRRRVYHNQCAGVFYPFLPEDEYFDRCHFPWFDQLEAATPDIQAELHALLDAPGDLIRPYVRFEEGTPDNKWSPLDDLRFDSGDPVVASAGATNEPAGMGLFTPALLGMGGGGLGACAAPVKSADAPRHPRTARRARVRAGPTAAWQRRQGRFRVAQGRRPW